MQLFYCQELLFNCSNELKNVMPTTQNINFARSSIVDVQKWYSSLLVSEALPVGLNPGDVVAVDEVAQVVDVVRRDVGAGPGELPLAGDHVRVDDEHHVALTLGQVENETLADDHLALELVEEPGRGHPDGLPSGIAGCKVQVDRHPGLVGHSHSSEHNQDFRAAAPRCNGAAMLGSSLRQRLQTFPRPVSRDYGLMQS